MNAYEELERQEIIAALDDAAFIGKEFSSWIEKKGFEFEDAHRGVWYFITKHGRIAYELSPLSGGMRITGCLYIPHSTNKGIPLVARGRSVSGKTLSAADLQEVDSWYTFSAIPDRVIATCAMEAGFAYSDVTEETRICDDLLFSFGDDPEKEMLLDAIFDELEIWFKFDRPDVFEQSDRFKTVRDIIEYVQKNFKYG